MIIDFLCIFYNLLLMSKIVNKFHQLFRVMPKKLIYSYFLWFSDLQIKTKLSWNISKYTLTTVYTFYLFICHWSVESISDNLDTLERNEKGSNLKEIPDEFILIGFGHLSFALWVVHHVHFYYDLRKLIPKL
jgi:hypothetical protein